MKRKQRIAYVAAHGTNDEGYGNWMELTGFTNKIEDCDLVIGLGGADVSAKYYKQPQTHMLFSSPHMDELEYADFQKAIKLGKKIIGICKSSQWGAALAGGAIFQDVNHPYYHEVTTFDGKKLVFNSTHHNMQDVSKLKENEDYKLLGWAENLSPYHKNGYFEDVKVEREAEIVFYPKINFLSIQPHPEGFFESHHKELQTTIKWCQGILTDFLENKLN